MPFEYKRHSQPPPHLPKQPARPPKPQAAGPAPDVNPLAAYQSTLNRAAVAAPARGRTLSGKPRPAKPIPEPGRLKRRIRRGVLVVLGLLIAGGIWWVFSSGHGKFNLASLLGAAAKTAIGHKDTLAGQDRGRTNILVYGMTKEG